MANILLFEDLLNQLIYGINRFLSNSRNSFSWLGAIIIFVLTVRLFKIYIFRNDQ